MNLLQIKWTIIWSIGILVLCFMPGKSFPSSDWFSLLQFDKWVHAFLFMMLFVIASYEKMQIKWVSQKKRSFYSGLIIAYCFFLAGSTELLQHFFTQDRFGDWLDFIANSIGVVFGLILLPRLKKWSLFASKLGNGLNQ